MQDLAQECVIGNVWPAATYNSSMSKSNATYVNMENNRYATFVINTGAVTTGEEFKIMKAKNKSGSSATDVTHPFVGNVYYLTTASKTSVTQTSVVSTGSIDTIDIADGHDSRVLYATVDAAQATSASYPYIAIVATASSMNAYLAMNVVLHGTRYQNETGYDAFA